MKISQLNKGKTRRIMYIENKEGEIEGSRARIGWVTFSKTGRTVYYNDRSLRKAKGGGIWGNFFDEKTGEEYWISGVKKHGANAHWAESVNIVIDEDAVEEFDRIKED